MMGNPAHQLGGLYRGIPAMAVNMGLAALTTRARITRGLMIAFFVLGGLYLAATAWVAWIEVTSYIGNLGRGAVVFVIGAIVMQVVLLPLGLFYFMWLHRASKNMQEQGLPDLQYTPAWAVLGYFIPVLNLVLPFRTMKELFNRSHGEPMELAQVTVDDASAWWSCTIAASLLWGVWAVLLLLSFIPRLYVIMPAGTHTLLLIFSEILTLAAMWFLYRLVGTITEAQNSGAFVGDTFE